MNFVRAETIVQEITDDGKVRDIITQVKKSEAEQEAEKREQILRSLPEFKRDGQSAAEQKATEQANEQQEKDDAAKEYNVHTIDEAEFEHYQQIEDAEREKKRKLKSEDAEAVAMFADERKRLREEVEEKRPDLITIMRQKNMEKSASKATRSVQERLKGKITVKAAQAKPDLPDAPDMLRVPSSVSYGRHEDVGDVWLGRQLDVDEGMKAIRRSFYSWTEAKDSQPNRLTHDSFASYLDSFMMEVRQNPRRFRQVMKRRRQDNGFDEEPSGLDWFWKLFDFSQ